MSSHPTEGGIRARKLSKTYTVNRPAGPGLRGAVRGLFAPQQTIMDALVDVDLDVDPGELVLLLGPNGAGKSTLIKILTGVISASSGEVRVVGRDPRKDRKAHTRNIGVVFGQRSQLWWDLPVRQSFRILQEIYSLPAAATRRRLVDLDEILSLSDFWDTRMRHLSLGQRVRADLAGALLHQPRVIFLDEPTIGMDVVVKDQVRQFLRREVEERDCCVLLTTHDMNEVSRLGQRVVVINDGRIVSDGDIEHLLQSFGGTFRIQVSLTHATGPVEVAGLRVIERRGSLVTLAPVQSGGQPAVTMQEALARVVQALNIKNLSIEEDDLEDVMRCVFQDTSQACTA